MSNRKALPIDMTHYVRDHCLCLHVQRAARALARRFDDALRPLGISQGQFSLLMSLNRPDPPTIGLVSTFLAMDRTTLTANLKPLQRRGLLKVAVDKEDKRNRRLTLTAAGHAVLIEAMPIWKKTHEAVDEALPANSPDSLRAMLALLS